MRQTTAACEASGKRVCSRCRRTLNIENFYRSSNGFSGWCKPCTRAAAAASHAARREQRKAYSRAYYRENAKSFYEYNVQYRKEHSEKCHDSYLRYYYGITREQYLAKLRSQHGQCAGCLRPFDETLVAAVDHCHRSGVFRGLLCSFCNRALGLVKDAPDTLRNMALYVRRN